MDQFTALADAFLRQVAEAIEEADEQATLEVDVVSGILTVTFEDDRQLILNKHTPTKQLWLSSPLSGASHYSYNTELSRWFSTRSGQELCALLNGEFQALAKLELHLES